MTEWDTATLALLRRLADFNKEIQEEARHALYIIWASLLYNAAKRRDLSDHDATSVMHDALMQVYLKHDQYDVNKGTPEQWIWGIFRNQLITQFRKKQPLHVFDPSEEELAFTNPSFNETCPEICMERIERCEGINRAWMRLDDAHRQEIRKKRKPGPVSKARQAALERFRQLLAEEDAQ